MLYVADSREVQLQYIATLNIYPSHFIYQGDKPTVFPVQGSILKNIIDANILPRIGPNSLALQKKDQDPKGQDQLDYINNVKNQIDDDARYYIGLGCKIDKLTYYYHSKYFNRFLSQEWFIVDQVQTRPLPDRATITVYQGDVLVYVPFN